jgi:aspartyl protease family protein
MIGWAFRQAVIWSILGLGFYIVVERLPTTPDAPEPVPPPAAASATAPAHSGAPNTLVFHANAQGHVVIDAVVNGGPVRFLVDTGATMVVLTAKDAATAGLGPNDLNFSMRTATANGTARIAPVRLREVRIGQLSIDDVPAAVAENLNISLLGQSFLTRLEGYQMRDGALTLNWY